MWTSMPLREQIGALRGKRSTPPALPLMNPENESFTTWLETKITAEVKPEWRWEFRHLGGGRHYAIASDRLRSFLLPCVVDRGGDLALSREARARRSLAAES